jgi:hypothetical protein
VCAGSALLLAEDESTSIINGTLIGVLLSQSASLSVVCLSSPRSTYRGFLTERKILLLYSSHLPLGVPNGLAIKQQSRYFLAPLPGKKWKTSARGVFRTHILYFVICFALLYLFLPASFFIKNPKKIRILGSCFYLSTFSFAKMSNPEVEVRSFKQQGGEI